MPNTAVHRMLTVFSVLAVTACSSNAVPPTRDSSATAGPELVAFQAQIEKDLLAARGTQPSRVPAEGPKAVANRRVVVLTFAELGGAYRMAKAAEDAAKSAGWDVTYINADGDLNKMSAGVQKAITLGADGIITASIDGAAVLSALQEAKDAGIKIVGMAAANSAADRETGVYDALVPALGDGETDGYLMGQQAFKLTGGNVQSISAWVPGYGYVDARERGWERFIEECAAVGGSCASLKAMNYNASDITTKLPQITASTVRANRDWTVLQSGFDAAIPFMQQGIESAGLLKDGAIAVGFDGDTASLDTIRKGGFQASTVGLSTLCIGYAATDNLNRLFAGEKPLSGAGIGCRNKLLDATSVPASGPWWGDVDVRKDYWQLWGVPTPSNPADVTTL